MAARNQTHYTDEFREQIVKLSKSGRPVIELAKEYGITKSTIYEWIRKYDNSGSFRDKSNRTQEQEELLKLRKENKQLRMEADLLKQAALIMARR